MIKHFRKKPVIIEAVQWDGSNAAEINDFAKDIVTFVYFSNNTISSDILINTLEGQMRWLNGDWVIKGVRGEFYPVKKDIFEETYEEVKA